MVKKESKQMAKEVKKEQGVTTTEKGVYIPKEKRMPYSPEYLHMSKAQFIEAEKKRRERELKHKELDVELDKGTEISQVKVAPAPQTPEPEKKRVTRGRPKKIE